MDPAFKDAPFSAPPEVFGVRLLPFCLGHAAVLLSMDSPLFSGEPWSARDLAAAVTVCSLPGFAFHEYPGDPQWAEKAVAIGQTSAAAEDWKEKALPAFLEYARGFMRSPRIWEKDGWKERGTPWPWAIAWALMERLPERRVWTMPLARASCYFIAAREEEGSVEVVTDQEREMIDAAEAASRKDSPK